MLKKSLTIPFELVLNHIIIKAKINGNADIKLVLDTGLPIGGAILFKSEKTEKLNLNFSGQIYIGGAGGDPVLADIAGGATINIGGLELFHKQVIVMSMNQNVINLLEADGMIGYELFSNYLLQIDFEKNLIHLWNSVDEVSGDFGQELNLELRQNYPFIKCFSEITKGNEVPLELVIDTGAGHALSLDIKSIENFSLPGNVLESRIGTGAIGDIMGNIGRVSKITIADYLFFDVVTTFSLRPLAKGFLRSNGNLGIDLLKRFLVTFDYRNSKIYLKPNVYFELPFLFNMAGFHFQKLSNGNFIIDFVMKDSPAYESGLIKNDVITQINSKPAALISTDTLDILTKRNSTTMEIIVQLRSELLAFNIKLRKIL